MRAFCPFDVTSSGQAVADALGVLLQRNFRAQLYDVLVDGVHEAVDTATYPIISWAMRSDSIVRL